MKLSATELAIQSLDAKIAALQAAKEHIIEAHEAIGLSANDDAPKAKRGRKKKGLPSAVPPASEANLTGRL